MKLRTFSMLVLVLVFSLLAVSARADTIGVLGVADSYAVLAGTTVTNVPGPVLGATVVTGDMGVSPGRYPSGEPIFPC